MPRVIHFEIAIDKADRAVKFYSEVFGWKVEKWGPMDYWLVQTGEGPGIDGALKNRERLHESTTNTVEVPSLEEYMAKVVDKGGEVISEKMTIPGHGYFAYCKDTEGNVFGIIESDESAQ
ncbi:MAG: VOC family protein [Methanothrix sp.]|jgi:Predicted enzyme related to lactoylglutathione lyase|uniref:Glyoxalase n=1 Tax=Methanothrix harundinacea TaxID=301375 RepID=A0A101IM22_9EURY|nr:MAG: glyoxalase [Methanosaeta sp. SDB]KUK45365.1 MAG: Glyoxalase [Methanothrix harundinacea]MDD2638794.1 VOC family protein [Methanothrix sp.]MDI9399653.1 VOC family protein [Euryarchaeota archaeon]KUK97715.1 MAG: Glyoxalase [Methanothrix harundinacea]